MQRSVTQSMPRAVTVSVCLNAAIPSFHQQSPMHQQAPAAGGQGRGPQCRYTPRLCHEREAVARTLLQLPSHLPYVGLQCCTSNGCSLFPISRELSRFHSREIGNEKVRESRAPGKLEPGNEFPTDEPLPVGNLNVEPVNSVCDLGVYLDTDMSMDTLLGNVRVTRTLSNLSVPVSASCDRYAAYVARYHVHHGVHSVQGRLL